jgi:hypothetical protein
LWHPSPQKVWSVDGHTQADLEQTCPGPHDTPQEPQLAGPSLMHRPSQTMPAQVHEPVRHPSPGKHSIPQPPQCRASQAVLTHSPSQSVSLASRHWQVPPLQASPVGHALPQAPQLLVSWSSVVQPNPAQ